MNAFCALCVVLFAFRERRRFFDYRCFTLVPVQWTRLDFFIYRLVFQWLLVEHAATVIYYYAHIERVECYMVAHHMLTIVLVSVILIVDFYNAYSLVPLCLHYLVALGLPYILPGFYGLYLSTYCFNLVIGTYLAFKSPSPWNEQQRVFIYILIVIIACHVANLLECGFSKLLAGNNAVYESFFLGLFVCQCLTFAHWWTVPRSKRLLGARQHAQHAPSHLRVGKLVEYERPA